MNFDLCYHGFANKMNENYYLCGPGPEITSSHVKSYPSEKCEYFRLGQGGHHSLVEKLSICNFGESK